MFFSAPVLDRGSVQRLLPEGRVESVDFEADIVIGRVSGGLQVPDDPFLSDEHARIRREGGTFVIEDLDSVNGTFLRLTEERLLRSGDRILIGGQIFEFTV